jgi:hypothetical protein
MEQVEKEQAMPQVRKLAREEVQAIENKGKGLRKLTEQQYDAFLSEYEVGDYGEAELDEGEKRLTVRNRLRAAASRREVGIEFKRIHGDIIRFRIVAPGSTGRGAPEVVPEVVSSEPPVPAKRKGGRPRKSA